MERANRTVEVTVPSTHSFTLVELLVSMAVMSILMVILLQTTATSLSLWRGHERKIATGREARAAVFQMRHDLQNMIVPSNTNLWPQIVGSSGVRFLALQPLDYQDTTASEGNSGEVCFVEYRLTGDAIERGAVDSKLTFESLAKPQPVFPGATNHQMLATNVLTNSWKLLTASGSTNVSTNDPPRFLEAYFKVAPNQDAADFYRSNAALFSGASGKANETKQQIEDFFLRVAVPENAR